MSKGLLMNEIKLIELKLNALKAKVVSEKPRIEPHTSADLYGFIKGAEDITDEDIDAVKIKLKEPAQ